MRPWEIRQDRRLKSGDLVAVYKLIQRNPLVVYCTELYKLQVGIQHRIKSTSATNLMTSSPAILLIVPYLLPLINLFLVFSQQSASGFGPALLALLHVFSNPIDALHNILKRQEIVRRCSVFAMSNTPDVAGEVAVILSIYDQWLADAQPHIVRCQTARQRRLTSRTPRHEVEPFISEGEKDLLRQAVLRLQCCWDGSSLKAKLSVLSYSIALSSTGYRVYVSENPLADQKLELAVIISIITLFDHLICAVYLNGCVGVFVHHEEVVRIMFRLTNALSDVRRTTSPISVSLFPRPSLEPPIWSSSLTLFPPLNAGAFSRALAEAGSASGAINCIRPQKKEKRTQPNDDRSDLILLAAATSAVAVSCIGAISIPLRASRFSYNAFVPQIVCAVLWGLSLLISTACSFLLTRDKMTVKTYSSAITVCDTVIASCLLGSVVWLLSASRHPGNRHKDQLTGSTLVAWAGLALLSLGLKGLLMIWPMHGGENARLMFVRSRAELLGDLEDCARIPATYRVLNTAQS